MQKHNWYEWDTAEIDNTSGWIDYIPVMKTKIIKSIEDSIIGTDIALTAGTASFNEYMYETTASSTVTYKAWQKCTSYYDNWSKCRVRRDDTMWYDYHAEISAAKEARPLSVRLKEIIDKRHGPAIILNKDRKHLALSMDIREERARETLRRVIGEDKYFAFLKNGFISVRARSGLSYQIFPAHGITCVYDKGKMVERLCVVLRGDFPATDSLIMRYLMILNNENQFRGLAIKHGTFERKPTQLVLPIQKSLVEVYKDMKKVA